MVPRLDRRRVSLLNRTTKLRPERGEPMQCHDRLFSGAICGKEPLTMDASCFFFAAARVANDNADKRSNTDRDAQKMVRICEANCGLGLRMLRETDLRLSGNMQR